MRSQTNFKENEEDMSPVNNAKFDPVVNKEAVPNLPIASRPFKHFDFDDIRSLDTAELFEDIEIVEEVVSVRVFSRLFSIMK